VPALPLKHPDRSRLHIGTAGIQVRDAGRDCAVRFIDVSERRCHQLHALWERDRYDHGGTQHFRCLVPGRSAAIGKFDANTDANTDTNANTDPDAHPYPYPNSDSDACARMVGTVQGSPLHLTLIAEDAIAVD